MGQDTFIELTQRLIPLSRNDGMFIRWCESTINVRTDKGMTFFDFSYNLECFDKSIDLLEYFLPSPKKSPAEALCKSEFIKSEMKNYDYTEMIVDPAFWCHNDSLNQEMTSVVMSAWSPRHFLQNRSVLAILNSIGGVDIVMQEQYKWKTFLNLSEYIQQNLEHNRMPQNFDELKESTYKVETSSICWKPSLNADKSCYFVTAQRNGNILFWQIFGSSQVPEIKADIQSNMSEIKNVLWIPRTETQFWLICADVLGQVISYDIEIKNCGFSLLRACVLWEHKDSMVASHLNYTEINGHIVFLFSKHRHFVAQVLDKNCKILTQYLNNINDYRIVDIVETTDGFYLGTINVKVFKLSMNYSCNTLTVNLSPVVFKDSYSTHELQGFCFSQNNILCAFTLIDRKLLCRKEVFKIEVKFLSTESKLESLMPTLLSNPTRKLTNYWDCIETLRYKITKTKTMPALDYDLLFSEASNDIYKLRIYFLLLSFYLYMRKVARVSSEFKLPENSLETVKEKILFLHAQSVVEKLYQKYQRDGVYGNSVEQEQLFGSVKYLETYSKKHKTELVMDKSTLDVVKKLNFEYICQSCDEKIDGFTCKSGHLNMYCMLTFSPKTCDEYLVCKCCSSTARTDISVDERLCVFCDQHLSKPD